MNLNSEIKNNCIVVFPHFPFFHFIFIFFHIFNNIILQFTEIIIHFFLLLLSFRFDGWTLNVLESGICNYLISQRQHIADASYNVWMRVNNKAYVNSNLFRLTICSDFNHIPIMLCTCSGEKIIAWLEMTSASDGMVFVLWKLQNEQNDSGIAGNASGDWLTPSQSLIPRGWAERASNAWIDVHQQSS